MSPVCAHGLCLLVNSPSWCPPISVPLLAHPNLRPRLQPLHACPCSVPPTHCPPHRCPQSAALGSSPSCCTCPHSTASGLHSQLHSVPSTSIPPPGAGTLGGRLSSTGTSASGAPSSTTNRRTLHSFFASAPSAAIPRPAPPRPPPRPPLSRGSGEQRGRPARGEGPGCTAPLSHPAIHRPDPYTGLFYRARPSASHRLPAGRAPVAVGGVRWRQRLETG